MSKNPSHWLFIPITSLDALVKGLQDNPVAKNKKVEKIAIPPGGDKRDHGWHIEVDGVPIIRVGSLGGADPEGDFDPKKDLGSNTCLGITRENLYEECIRILNMIGV